MYELLKTLFILSLFGGCLTVLLFILKPITAKRLSAKWQYAAWIAVLVLMIVPFYKCIPKSRAKEMPFVPKTAVVTEQQVQTDGAQQNNAEFNAPIEYKEVTVATNVRLRLTDLAAYIWGPGAMVFLLTLFISYFIFLNRKKKNSTAVSDGEILKSVKKELGIKRNIPIRMADDVSSPMLIGVLFPCVYIPSRTVSDDKMRMILRHELTHYKRGDLVIKWFAALVNAVHWFNPLCYLARKNLSEACEISCDMAVTHNMSEEELKVYMQTILELAERKEQG